VDPSRHLLRIGHRGAAEPTLETLRALHLAHLTSVPFENLDIHLGRPIVLDEAALFRKIVEQRRGGFCYELNGLFAGLLRALGFQVTMLSARVVAGGGTGPEFDHLALRVDLPEGRFLADVGFGRSFREPLAMDAPEGSDEDSEAEGTHYRVVPGQPDWAVQWRSGDRPAEREYLFTLTPRRLEEYAQMCEHHQTSPGSTFTRKRLCTLATADGGRITFLNGSFTELRAGVKTERALSDAEVGPLLRDRFGIAVSDAEVRGWSQAPAPR
jgi:N-hydroxyarylamine O-acetyltransferase